MRCPTFHLVTCAGGQASPFLRNPILFCSILVISVSPSSLAVSSQHIIILNCSPIKTKKKTLPILPCLPGTTSVLSFPSPIDLQILHTKCLFPFLSFTSVINIYFLWNGPSFTMSSRCILVFIRLDGSSIPFDTETSLHSSFGTRDLSFSRCTYLRLLPCFLHRLPSPCPALRYWFSLGDILYLLLPHHITAYISKMSHQWWCRPCTWVLWAPMSWWLQSIHFYNISLPDLIIFMHPISFQNVTLNHENLGNESVHRWDIHWTVPLLVTQRCKKSFEIITCKGA